MKEIKLGEVLDVKRGTSLSGKFYENSGTYIRLTLGNFTYPECGWKDNTSKDDLYYSGDFKNEYLLKKDDIITPLTEQVRGLLGNTARIPESDLYIQSGDIGKIIPFEKLLDKNFAYYLVSSPIVKKQLDAASQQTKIRHTSPDAIKNCIAFIPELASQKKIANLLDSLNKKISTNNCIISELESLAKTIYDYWFLQFEFPNEDGKPYKSSGGKMVWNEELKREIPEGWGIETLGDIIGKVSNSVKSDKTNGLPYTPMDELPMRKMSFGSYKSDKEANSSLLLYKKNQLLFGSMRAYFHRVCIAPFDGITRTTTFVFEPKVNGSLGYSFETLNLDSTVNYAVANSIGTQQPYAVWEGSMSSMKLPKVPLELKLEYSSKIELIIQKVISNNLENQELASLRDFLLPMLMNGQVTFKD